MKQRFTYLCMWVLCCLTCTNAFALEKNTDGVYEIGTAAQLVEFANIVNGGETEANAILTADIDFSNDDYVVIGNDQARYKGTFDGQFHKIDNIMYIGSSDIGLFGVVDGGCVIKNLIAGSGNSFIGDAQDGMAAVDAGSRYRQFPV